MRISDWSSDVCSSDLPGVHLVQWPARRLYRQRRDHPLRQPVEIGGCPQWLGTIRFGIKLAGEQKNQIKVRCRGQRLAAQPPQPKDNKPPPRHLRSEEHTSELQSLMRISYAVFCLKKKKK